MYKIDRKIILSSLFLILTGSLNAFLGKNIINNIFPTRFTPTDIFFKFIEYQDWAFYMPNIIQFVMVAILVLYFYQKGVKNLSVFLNSLAIVYLLRFFVILLTPFASPEGITHQYVNYDSTFWDNGYFFSGHTAFFLFTYLTVKKENIYFNYITFIFLLLGILTILLSRHHYSIDIYGGVVTALAIYWGYTKPRLEVDNKL